MVKRQFISEMETRLKDFEGKLERLAETSAPKSEHGRLERAKTYYFLKASHAELCEKLRRAKYAPDESWREFKHSMGLVYEDMARQMAGAQEPETEG